jgi:hypothetical protein
MKIIVSFAAAAFVTSLFAKQGVPLNQPTGLGKRSPGHSDETLVRTPDQSVTTLVRSTASASTTTIERPETAHSSRSKLSLHSSVVPYESSDFFFQPAELERMGF